MVSHNVLNKPWCQVDANLFEVNRQQYFFLVDYYSGFLKVSELNSTQSRQIITYHKSQFAQHDIPDVLITDNGPRIQNIHKKHNNVEHHTSSPIYS